MMLNPLLLASLIGTLSYAAPGGNLVIRPEMVKFHYDTHDGSIGSNCSHSIQNAASQDWRVVCGKKDYVVHLWVSSYLRDNVPKNSYELLYWITDLSNPTEPKGTGSSVWFHFKEASELHLVTVRESVDSDTAGLSLELDPTK